MGYYTDFGLEVHPFKYQDKVERCLSRYLGGIDVFNEEYSWYDHEEDMLHISKTNPDVLMILTGEGEKSGDIWRDVYLNGEQVSSWKLEVVIPYPQDLVDMVNKKQEKNSKEIERVKRRVRRNLTPEEYETLVKSIKGE